MELSLINKKNNQQIKDWLVPGSFLLVFLICFILFETLIKAEVLLWPFRRVDNIAGTYKNILFYTPILIAAVTSLIWLKISNISFAPIFKWQRFSKTFWIGVIISAGYSIYLYTTCRFNLKGYEYWLAVVVLSLMNAVSEEFVFRLTFYNLVKKIVPGPVIPNLFQSLLYASIHLPIGGIRLASLAFCYGLLLGVIMEKDKSVIPCVICHFLIDIGNIGLPLLIDLPVG